jgi:hypothetical protein
MAQQNITIGTQDAGDGDTLFAAFTKVEANFTELYSDDAGDVDSVNGQSGTVVLDSDDIAEGSTNLYNQTHTGDVTGSTALTIANDVVDHAQLSNSYTALSALGTGSSFAINFDSAATFTATANAAATLTMSNAQQGQVVDIILDGNYAITLAETGSTFNKVGSTNYDGSTNNVIQIICTDDTSGSKIYHYAVAPYTSSTTV